MPGGPAGTARLTTNVPGLSFGVKEAADPPVVRTFAVANEGDATSGSLGITIEGTGGASFWIDTAASPCIGRELEAGTTCSVAIAFGGPAEGPQSATAFVDDGEGRDRIGVTLNGILQATQQARAIATP